jgi:hypothetical protein
MKVGLFIIYSAWLACTKAHFDLVKVILMFTDKQLPYHIVKRVFRQLVKMVQIGFKNEK